MKLLARVEAFSQLGKYPVVLMRFLFDDGVIRTEERIQLRTPDGRVIDTEVGPIPHVKYLPSAQRDPYLVSISLGPGITKQDAPPGTEIWNLKD